MADFKGILALSQCIFVVVELRKHSTELQNGF
jgi:hypothetical protein